MHARSVPVLWVVAGLMATVCAGEPRPGDEVLAKVDGTSITRDDVSCIRRILTVANPELSLNNRQVLDYLITCVLWDRYAQKQGLRPSGAQITRAIQALDARLRREGSTYDKALGEHRLLAEEDGANLSFELAMQHLAYRLLGEITVEQVRAEFEARPEWYDRSRIRVSEVFVDTRDFGDDPDKVKKAKDFVERMYKELEQGKDFARYARDFSCGRASERGGDLGWFLRNGQPVDEPVVVPTWPFEGPKRRPRALAIPQEPPAMDDGRIVSGLEAPRRAPAEPLEEVLAAAAWWMKIGEFSKPVRSARGWHILKVTEREAAYLTFQGAQAAVKNALVRRRIEAILDELRAKAKIEDYLHGR